MKSRPAWALALGWILVCPQWVAAATLDAANWGRLHGCGVPAVGTPFRVSPKLEQAARSYADGATLQNAVAGSGYLAAQSAAIHLSGPASDAEIERMLTAHDCRTLRDPKLLELGSERRGRDLWIVLAAPVALPNPNDAASVARRYLGWSMKRAPPAGTAAAGTLARWARCRSIPR